MEANFLHDVATYIEDTLSFLCTGAGGEGWLTPRGVCVTIPL